MKIKLLNNFICYLLLLFLFSCPSTLFGENASISINKGNASAISGRLWTASGTPLGGAYVFVASSDGKELLGYTVSSVGSAPDVGWFQVLNLPAGKDVLIVAFSPKQPSVMAIQETKLDEQFKTIYSLSTTADIQGSSPSGHENIPSSMLGDLLNLAGTVINEINSANSIQVKEELADNLLSQLPDTLDKSVPDSMNELKQELENLSNQMNVMTIESDSSQFRIKSRKNRKYGWPVAWDKAGLRPEDQARNLDDYIRDRDHNRTEMCIKYNYLMSKFNEFYNAAWSYAEYCINSYDKDNFNPVLNSKWYEFKNSYYEFKEEFNNYPEFNSYRYRFEPIDKNIEEYERIFRSSKN